MRTAALNRAPSNVPSSPFTLIGFNDARLQAGLFKQPYSLHEFLVSIDELLDVALPVAERVHLGGTTCLAAGFHHVRHLIVNFQKRQRTAGPAAAAQFFFAGANR